MTNIVVDRVFLDGRWRSPNLVIDRLRADLYGHQADVTAQVNVGTRAVQSRISFDFDVHRIERLLSANSRRWLRQYTWNEPPKVNAEAILTLAAWTNTQPDWRGEVLPTIRLNGELEGRDAAFRGVGVSHAQSHFSYSNFVWRLPDFVAACPDGRVEFVHTSDQRTHDYYFKVRSRIDPRILKPLFEDKGSRALDYFQFTEPPLVEGEVRGRWREPDRTGVSAQVKATNFTFRGEPVSELIAGIHYTNRLFLATDPKIRSGEETVSADRVGFNLPTFTLFLTNGLSAMDPARITRAIGPKVTKTLSPYVFKMPPAARVNGFVEVRRGKQANMQFDLSGGPFSYWKFNLPQISGTVLWRDETVTITNVTAGFYNGKLDGDLYFDFSAADNADFRLNGRVTDTDLHLLMNDLSSPTNKLEGMLSGNLTITKANSGDWKSWTGSGDAHLRDGFLWGIPVFGIFSDILDAVIPGLGNSRVSGGTATFVITNSVIHTDDMEIRSPAARLAYRGTIDFEGNVDARVEARILRDVWLVGPLVSLVFSPLTKLFEYKVSGTLHEPKKVPLYIPKELFFPFHPFKVLKELFSPEKPTSALPDSEKPPAPQP